MIACKPPKNKIVNNFNKIEFGILLNDGTMPLLPKEERSDILKSVYELAKKGSKN